MRTVCCSKLFGKYSEATYYVHFRCGWQWDFYLQVCSYLQRSRSEQTEGAETCANWCYFPRRASPASPRRSPRSSRDGRRWSAGRRRRWWRNERTSVSAAGMEGSWFLARSRAAPRFTTPTASTWPRDPQVSARRGRAQLGARRWLQVSRALLAALHSLHSVLKCRRISLAWTDFVAQPWFAPHCDCEKINCLLKGELVLAWGAEIGIWPHLWSIPAIAEVLVPQPGCFPRVKHNWVNW